MSSPLSKEQLDAFLASAARLNVRRLVTQTPHGIYMVDPRDREIGRSLLLRGEFEYQEKCDWFQFITGGADKIFIDIGANIGTTTVPILLNDYVGGIVAFEPDPNNYHLLSYNIKANNLENRVAALQCALSNRSGTVQFERSGDNFGDHRVRYQELPNGSYNEGTRTTIEVPCRTLDEIVKGQSLDLGRIAAVKCDTQGSEGFILDGAATILQARIPWIIEFWPYGIQRSGFDRGRLVSLVTGAFARFAELRNDAPARIRPIGEFANLFAEYQQTAFCNLILLPE